GRSKFRLADDGTKKQPAQHALAGCNADTESAGGSRREPVRRPRDDDFQWAILRTGDQARPRSNARATKQPSD
ncbi:MAG TPA: hypothetical protein PLV92_05020, partial [Pirellulaceae bacterium]|nr:hypothetical protein [Pirellulaceae bacterium]